MPDLRNRRVVVYSAVAVAVAIALTVAVSLAFPSPNLTTTLGGSESFAPGFCPSNSNWLSEPTPVGTLAPNGTVTVDGTTYWYATFVPTEESLAGETYHFEGVNFTEQSASSAILTGIQQWSVTNATVLEAPIDGGRSCSFYLPSFGISFSDGSEYFLNSYVADLSGAAPNATLAVAPSPGSAIDLNAAAPNATLTFQNPPTSDPWFTPQTAPRAGVGYEADGGALTLYVSTS